MDSTAESRYRCGLCKKTFKQKSSLVRHTKRCTLEPTPSVRQRACCNCIGAKARCDLRRPFCSRCESRNITCAYSRPAPADNNRPTPLYADNSGSVPRTADNSGTAANFPGCGLVSSQLSLELEALASTDTTVVPYLDYASSNLTSISDAGPALYSCSVPEIFQCDMAGATTLSGPGFDSIYSNSCGHYDSASASASASSYAESGLDARLALDNGNSNDSSPGADTNSSADRLPVSGEGGKTFSGGHSTDTTQSGEEDLAPWILALADRTITPDLPRLVEHSADTLFRAFRSWPRMLAKGIQLPPIIHLFQLCCDGKKDISKEVAMPNHIARCITLCKMWVGQAGGSGQIVQDAIRGEAECILAKYHTYDAPTLLASMQSLAILIIMLLFPANRQPSISAMAGHIFASVQEMASHVLSTGMVLHEEASHVRPPWRIWAHIEAKRRTLASIYFMHWAYSVYKGTRHLNCMQMGFILAPSPKWLWQATDEKVWMNLYARWLAQWNGREPVQAEFFLVEKGPVLDPRVEMWLEDADELGVLMMSIMNAS